MTHQSQSLSFWFCGARVLSKVTKHLISLPCNQNIYKKKEKKWGFSGAEGKSFVLETVPAKGTVYYC
jgi:hypothetical protein